MTIKIETREQERRVIEAIAECDRILDRARRYSPEFQDQKLIAQTEAHKAKLQSALTRSRLAVLASGWNSETANRRVGGTFGS